MCVTDSHYFLKSRDILDQARAAHFSDMRSLLVLENRMWDHLVLRPYLGFIVNVESANELSSSSNICSRPLATCMPDLHSKQSQKRSQKVTCSCWFP